MRRIRTLLGATVAGACLLAGLPGVALAAPTAPYTVLTVDLGEHRTKPVASSGVYDPTNATIDAAATANDTFRITAVYGVSAYVRLDAAPPTGQTWTEGQTYETAKGSSSARARLDLNDERTSFCMTGTGSLTVHEVVRDPATQSMTGLAASYEYHCDGDPAALTGEIRWNSTVGYVAALPDPTTVDFSGVYIGDSPKKWVSIRSLGSEPVTFGTAILGGPNPEAFEITTEDICSGRTLPPGSTCGLTVWARPTTAGLKTAVLYLPDNSTAGRRAVPLRTFAIDGSKGTYYSVAPARLMDTRDGLGARKGKIGPKETVQLQVTGRGGLPLSGVAAAVLNVTVTGPTQASFLTVYPSTGGTPPTASSINFAAGWLGSNNVTVKVDAYGRVAIYNRNGYTDVVVDVVGFYSDGAVPGDLGKGGQYQPFEPYRILDTRLGTRGPLPAGTAVTGWIDFKAAEFGDFNAHVKALVLNITAVKPEKAGFFTAWSGEGSKPLASTVNYGAGKVVPNLAYVQTVPCPSGGCGGATGAPRYKIFTLATSHLVVDLVGVIDDGTVADGLRFRPSSPTRIADSRIWQGLGELGPGETDEVTVPSWLVDEQTQALAMNVTAVTPQKDTVLTVWPADVGLPKPSASNLNPAAGQIVSNGVLGIIGPKDAFHVHNLTGYTGLVVDLVGTFYVYPVTAGAATLTGSSRPQVAGTGSTEYVRG
ncbi:choice-of-anchor D domain-containing protein [Micromonospora sp. MS34]|uniref:choice-of-anchor D domain-containing protein n=1 Tax=Micromonospora sp. MS34 TaxID=3385971 RepID=UPI00399FCEE9